MRIIASFALASISACAAAEVQPPRATDAALATGVWSYTEHVEDLRAASCPEGEPYLRAESIDIRVIEAERGGEQAQSQQLTGLTLAGAWQLESKESNFGGLSGLSVMRSGSLLAISDAGAFIWIGIDAETGMPDGIGAISYMRDLNGNYFANKRDGIPKGSACETAWPLSASSRITASRPLIWKLAALRPARRASGQPDAGYRWQTAARQSRP